MKIAITGCSGLVGSALVEHLFASGHTIHCLQRNTEKGGLIYDPKKIDLIHSDEEPIEAVIHLAGENISTGRWSRRKKKGIFQSRVQSTHELASYFSNLETPPKVMIFASAIGYYGSKGDQKLTEKSESGTSFLADVCKSWEEAAGPATEAGIRVAFSRFGMVLSPNGGALQKMLPPFKAGLGGKIGNGKQYMSWISIRDLVAALEHLLINEELTGPFNFVSPNPVTNSEFTRVLGRSLQRHTILPLPATIVKILLGEMGKELLLASSRVYPEKLISSGYSFRYAHLKEALSHCIDAP